jgi:hypothetical protein
VKGNLWPAGQLPPPTGQPAAARLVSAMGEPGLSGLLLPFILRCSAST